MESKLSDSSTSLPDIHSAHEIELIRSTDDSDTGRRFNTETETFFPERHKNGSGKYIKSIIYGGLDGIISVFVTIAAGSGSDIGIGLALALGLAKLFAGGISMGVGDWLATDAEVDMAKRERKREEWECENFIEGEIEEMIELYVSKGLDYQSATTLVNILASNKKTFVDIMMAEELGISQDTEDAIPWKHGAVNFASFLTLGFVPLIAFVIIIGIGNLHPYAFYASIVITFFTLLGMGIMKGALTGSSIWKSALLTVGLGTLTAFIGWFSSYILNRAFPSVNIPQ